MIVINKHIKLLFLNKIKEKIACNAAHIIKHYLIFFILKIKFVYKKYFKKNICESK
jgi:hypothetical protein